MIRILRTNPAPFHALLRIVSGLIFLMHGTQKMFGVPPGMGPIPLHGRMGLAAVIETVCGFLITIGLFTGIAAFIASGEMAVAYFTGHFPKGFFPVQNQGDPAVLLCFLFLFLAVAGPGIWSVDGALDKRRGHASN